MRSSPPRRRCRWGVSSASALTTGTRPASSRYSVSGRSPRLATKITQQAPVTARFEGLTPEQLIHAFRIMHTARRLDDREVVLKRQNRIFFQISGAGHEAIQVAAGMSFRARHDLVYPHYPHPAPCPAPSLPPP